MARLSKVAVEDFEPELRTMAAADGATALELNATSIYAHNPRLAKAMLAFAGELWGATSLSPRLIEMVRLRVAFHNQCRSCMAIRYRSAVDDGLTEGMVCSLERPHEAADLTPAEKAALAYADLASTNHFSIGDETFEGLRAHFSEAEIVELGAFIGFFIGFGRLAASWDMVEDLPDAFQDKSAKVAPWERESVLVRG